MIKRVILVLAVLLGVLALWLGGGGGWPNGCC